MFYFFFLLILSIFHCTLSNPNQYKPFGTIGLLKNVEEIDGKSPDTLQFFSTYISKSEPILSRQVLINDQHFNIWKNDEQLEKEVNGLGKINVVVESIHQQKRIQMKFGDFLDKYQNEHLFLADNLPEILRKYIVVPRPLQCEAVLSTLPSVSMVMNDISTSPLIFNAEFDPLLCLYRGNKRVVLVNTKKYPDVRQYLVRKNRQPPVNPDRVDLNQFPALANIEYHIANITAGDCLLIPSGWIFQERSLDSTISIIYNLDHQQGLNVDLKAAETCSTSDTYDPSFTLDQIDWSNTDTEPQSLKEVMLKLINSKSNTFDKWQQTFSKYFSFDLSTDPETAGIFDEFYGIIDVNGDGEITATEVEQIDGVHQHHISDILYEMARAANDKQTSNSGKEVPIEHEDLDEQLHLQDYKSDL